MSSLQQHFAFFDMYVGAGRELGQGRVEGGSGAGCEQRSDDNCYRTVRVGQRQSVSSAPREWHWACKSACRREVSVCAFRHVWWRPAGTACQPRRSAVHVHTAMRCSSLRPFGVC